MRKPIAKPRGGRSQFNWWRRFKTHKPLSAKQDLLDRIEHRDFEYPDQFKQAQWELDWAQEECDAFAATYKGNEDPKTDSLYLDIQRKGRKRYYKNNRPICCIYGKKGGSLSCKDKEINNN
mgnify:CR=1 FL=1